MNRFTDRPGLTLCQSFVRLAKRDMVEFVRKIHGPAQKQAICKSHKSRHSLACFCGTPFARLQGNNQIGPITTVLPNYDT